MEADDWLEDGVSAQVSEESVQVLPSETENIAESIEEAVDLVEPITIDEEVDQEVQFRKCCFFWARFVK